MTRALDLVTVDLDGTLIRDTVFLAVARGEGLEEAFLAWDRAYFAGEMSLEACFHAELGALAGRPAAPLRRHLETAAWVPGIREAVAQLHDAGAEVRVLTDQPRFLVSYLDGAGFDGYLCSDVALEDGLVTTRLTPAFDKRAVLGAHLAAAGIAPERVAHVGNGRNDVPVFDLVGRSVAVAPDVASVAAAADAVVDPLLDLRQAADAVLALDSPD